LHHETDTKADISLIMVAEEKNSFRNHHSNVYKYACEDCDYIMTFTKEKIVESKKEEHERKQRKNDYDWTDFGR
jgi:hypothetical protein